MTPLSRNILLAIAILSLIVGSWAIFAGRAMIGGGGLTTVGSVVIWSSAAAQLMALVAIAFALFQPKRAAFAALVAFVLILPFAITAIIPAAWCIEQACETAQQINWRGLLLVILFGLPAWLLREV